MSRYKIIVMGILFSMFAFCGQPENNNDYVKIDFKEISIKDFVHKISELTGNEITFEKPIKGVLHFKSAKYVLKSELMSFLSEFISDKGMMLVATGARKSVIMALYPAGCYEEKPKIKNIIAIKVQMYKYIFRTIGLRKSQYYFLDTNKGDESLEVLSYFKNMKPKVVAASVAKITPVFLGNNTAIESEVLIHHRENGKSGIIVSVNCVSQEKKNEIQIAWSYYTNRLNSGGYIATLIFENGHWVVTKNEELWVS